MFSSLVKLLNDNFGVKVSEKTIKRVLNAHDIEWTKPILRKNDESIKKSRIEFCKYYLYIVDNARYVYIDESHFYQKNPYSERWVFPGEEFYEEQRKYGCQRISGYGAISRKAKFQLVFFIGNMDSKNILNEFKRSCQIPLSPLRKIEVETKDIRDIFDNKFSYIWTTMPSMYRLRI